jgi:hypothetical protein
MQSEIRDDMTVHLRSALRALLPTPTREFRRRAWETFERALDRHLAGQSSGVSRPQTQR